MEVGCYTTNLYCDNDDGKHPYGEFPHEFIGETHGECTRKAKKHGWKFRKIDGVMNVICPICNGKNKE